MAMSPGFYVRRCLQDNPGSRVTGGACVYDEGTRLVGCDGYGGHWGIPGCLLRCKDIDPDDLPPEPVPTAPKCFKRQEPWRTDPLCRKCKVFSLCLDAYKKREAAYEEFLNPPEEEEEEFEEDDP